MTDSAQGIYEGASAEMVANLRKEYVSDLAEDLLAIEKEIAAAAADAGHAPSVTEALRALAFDMKGHSHNFGLSIVHTVAHRLGDYLSSVDVLSNNELADSQVFIELLNDAVSGDISPDTDVSQLVRGLPAKPLLDPANVEVREAEIMLVMIHGAATKKVQRELQECGYRVTIVTSTFDALPLIIRTKPELVVISAVMNELNGIDLTIALKAMTETRNIPVALITSFGREHENLRHLPKNVPVIQKGPTFPDDIADALEFHFLI